MIKRTIAPLTATLWGLIWCTQSFAQSTPPTPPIRPLVDANYVNLVTGYMQLAPVAMSIGPVGSGGLTYTPLALIGQGLEEGTDIQYTGTVQVTNWTTYNDYYVTIGTYAEDFHSAGNLGIFSQEGLSSTLTESSSSFTYTGPDGTVAVFSKSVTNVGGGEPSANITSLTLPNGEKRTYNYVTATVCSNSGCTSTYTRTRLQSVTNNRGYQIKFLYSSNASSPLGVGQDGPWLSVTSAMGINMAVDYCDPLASSCSGTTQAWPTASVDASLNVIDAAGEKTQYNLGTSTYSITLPGNSSPNLVYTITRGQVTSVTRNGQTWNYSYSSTSTDLTTTVTDPLNRTSTYDFDATTYSLKSYTNNVTQEVTSYQNDSSGRTTGITLPSGQTIQYTYDARGNVSETDLLASGQPTLSWTANFDATCGNPKTCNKPNWTKDPEQNETDYTYDSSSGQLTSVTLPAPTSGAIRPVTQYTWAPYTAYYKNSSGSIVADGTNVYYLTYVQTCRTTAGCQISSSDHLSTTINYGSDGVANNRLPSSATTQDGAGAFVATRTFGYDVFGNLTSVTGPMAFQSTAMTYDAMRRVTGTVGPSLDGSGTYVGVRTTLDSRGFPTTVDLGTLPGQTASAWQSFNPLQTIVRQFDADGRVTQTSQQAGGATYAVQQVSYDAVGRIDCTATRMNLGSIPSTACTLGTQGSFGPDRITKYYYDGADRVTSEVSGYGTSGAIPTKASYYPGGALETVTDGNGYVTTYDYDPYGRLQYIKYPDPQNVGLSSNTDFEEFWYDQDSHVIEMQRRSGDQIQFIRDALGRLSEMQLPSSWDSGAENVFYSYDNQGRLLSALYGSTTGTGITQSYDGLGRLQTRTVFGRTLTYGYDLANHLTKLTYPDGFFVNYNFTNEELQTIVDSNNATLATFKYDALGSRTQLLRPNGANTTYTPDAIERLQQLTQDLSGTSYDTTASFTYNPAGQIATKAQSNDAVYTWLPSPANQTISSPADKQNQLLTFNGVSVSHDPNTDVKSGINSQSYTYDPIGQLRTAASSTGTINIDYDPSGMLRREVNGSTETDYLYDGGNLVAEYVNGTITARFVHGPGVDEPLVWYQGANLGTKIYLHADEHGSIIAASDASGAATGTVKYSSYGEAGGALPSPFGYTGQLYLADLQLYYYKARMYSPQTGRFLQPDPAGYMAGTNLYGYVGGDPVNLRDPGGMDPCVLVSDNTKCAAPLPDGCLPGMPMGQPPCGVTITPPCPAFATCGPPPSPGAAPPNQPPQPSQPGNSGGGGGGPGSGDSSQQQCHASPIVRGLEVVIGGAEVAAGAVQAVAGILQTGASVAGTLDTGGISLLGYAGGLTNIAVGAGAVGSGTLLIMSAMYGTNPASLPSHVGQYYGGDFGSKVGELVDFMGQAVAFATSKRIPAAMEAAVLNVANMVASKAVTSAVKCAD